MLIWHAKVKKENKISKRNNSVAFPDFEAKNFLPNGNGSSGRKQIENE